MSHGRTSREIRKQDKEQLEAVGFKRSSRAWYGTRWRVLTPVVLAVAAIVILFYLGIFNNRINIKTGNVDTTVQLDTAVQAGVFATALLALLIGLSQWRAARDEVSLDTIYQRMEETNKLLDGWEEVWHFAGPWPTIKGLDKKSNYRHVMYVYRELDNFEYAVEKYRIGLMEPQTAHRVLRTFQARCKESDLFCCLALKCVNTLGYSQETQQIVEKVVEKMNPEIVQKLREEGCTSQSGRGRIRLVAGLLVLAVLVATMPDQSKKAPLLEKVGRGKEGEKSNPS